MMYNAFNAFLVWYISAYEYAYIFINIFALFYCFVPIYFVKKGDQVKKLTFLQKDDHNNVQLIIILFKR